MRQRNRDRKRNRYRDMQNKIGGRKRTEWRDLENRKIQNRQRRKVKEKKNQHVLQFFMSQQSLAPLNMGMWKKKQC